MSGAIKLRFWCNEHGFVAAGFDEPITKVHFNQRGEIGLACPLCFKSRPMTIERWTGLADKNGVDIYDGDCFWFDEDENGTIMVVAYKNKMSGRGESVAQFAFELYGNSHFIGEGGQDCFGAFQHLQDIHLDEFELSEMEVVGNIRQNPELLEGRP